MDKAYDNIIAAIGKSRDKWDKKINKAADMQFEYRPENDPIYTQSARQNEITQKKAEDNLNATLTRATGGYNNSWKENAVPLAKKELQMRNLKLLQELRDKRYKEFIQAKENKLNKLYKLKSNQMKSYDRLINTV